MPTAHENRAAFMARIVPLHAPSTVRRIMAAYDRSKENHRSQKRKGGERYFEHPRGVALILIDELGCIDADLMCAALLHDVLEDACLVGAPFTAEGLEELFGERVCRIVVRLSKIPKEGYHDRLARFGTWEEFMVKLCDQLHNLRSMDKGTTPEWRRKQRLESREVYVPLFGQLTDLVPLCYRKQVEYAVREVIERVDPSLP